ncbi:MAG: hypothetical protein JSV57_00910 [Candidatus Bathyarchaeota archaeon]|nr:MAG: hypothetical protein JSV57_00910 [Candidatus Bathyarchaeota archaeon]
MRLPWTTPVQISATEEHEYTVLCFSKEDLLQIDIYIKLRWQLHPQKIDDLYRGYPELNYKSEVIEPIIEETVVLIVKDFTLVETIEFRDALMLSMENALIQTIESEPSLEGAITELAVDANIEYPAKSIDAVRDSAAMEQAMEMILEAGGGNLTISTVLQFMLLLQAFTQQTP